MLKQRRSELIWLPSTFKQNNGKEVQGFGHHLKGNKQPRNFAAQSDAPSERCAEENIWTYVCSRV